MTPSIPIPATYRAYRYAELGKPADVLQLRSDVPQTPLSASQVRVKVLSAALNPADPFMMAHYIPMLLSAHPSVEEPFGFGFDGAGVVVEVGRDVRAFHIGDSVYFQTSFTTMGSCAEYLAVEHEYVALKPKNLSFDQAASMPLVSLTSYQALVEHSKLQRGERVLVIGGSSGTGVMAIQLAKALGASYVIATTSSRNVELVKSIGADEVIDYTTTKWGDVLDRHSVDVIYDCGFERDAWNEAAQRVLKKETGRFVTLVPMAEPIIDPEFGAKLIGNIIAYPTAEHLRELTKLIESGKIKPVIDSVFAFEDVVDAVAKLNTRRTRGKIVISIAKEE
ncbi:Quinone oxidoreductase protein [Globisporangium polare]